MKSSLKKRRVRFFVQDGCLVHEVTSDEADGRNYVHRCDRAAFETVAHALAETPAEGGGTTMTEIARREGIPFTRVNVGLEFLKARGLAEVRHRRCYPGSVEVYLDAMIEFYALADALKPD